MNTYQLSRELMSVLMFNEYRHGKQISNKIYFNAYICIELAPPTSRTKLAPNAPKIFAEGVGLQYEVSVGVWHDRGKRD